jgi:ACS family tartrate transporter-like MFS transporter
MVERWSARKWICRIMVTWGFTAALTALVKTPGQFYFIRFLLGLAEAGFFPGVLIYLTHWFPGRDRTRAIACFMAAAPLAQITSPRISYALLRIGTTEVVNGVSISYPPILGLQGWQWMYIAWGIPAVILGIIVLFMLPDKPRNASWLSIEEKLALEERLGSEKASRSPRHRMKFSDALRHPKVLLLAFAFFCGTTGTYGIEFFLPSILERWYSIKLNAITWLVTLPPCLALCGQLFVGWNSDRTQERCYHAFIPIAFATLALALAPWTQGHLVLTIACFMVAVTGLKAYQPAFWSLPTLFLTETAAAASIGLINSVGNLGGFLGPYVIGANDKATGSFVGGIYFVCGAMFSCAVIILSLQLGRRKRSL